MENGKLLYLSAGDVAALLDWDSALRAATEAFRALALGAVAAPQRLHLNIPETEGVQLIKPAYSAKAAAIGVKMISLFNRNPERNLPFSHALMTLFDGETGRPLAVMDGDVLTAIRTGAAAGIATQYLAREDGEILGIVGAGKQARTQFQAISRVRKLKKVILVDKDHEKARQFAKELEGEVPAVEVSTEPRVLPQAQIISTVTTAGEAVLGEADVAEGCHINAMGAFKAHQRELPGKLLKRAKVYVDYRPACLTEAGDILLAEKEGYFHREKICGEIGEVVLGKTASRSEKNEITIFKSVGHAVQDLTAAVAVYQKAKEQQAGQWLPL
ncbi:MAG: ornithine cyclodeaminase family protein [Calditrichia bacterium]